MTPNIFPALHYRGDDGAVHHAELRLGDGLIMFGGVPADGPGANASQSNGAQPPVTIYAVVTDPDAHYTQSRAAGAEIVRELADQPYGSREYGARDLEGNAWSFGTYDPYAA